MNILARLLLLLLVSCASSWKAPCKKYKGKAYNRCVKLLREDEEDHNYAIRRMFDRTNR